jgi:2,3-dihydroxybenzoate decarboxylase
MQDPVAAATEFERAVHGLGFCGALVNGYSSVGNLEVGRYYDDPEYEPLWAAVEDLGAPFYLHPRNPLPNQRRIYEGREELLGPTWAFAVETGTHALRLITSGLFDRHPRATVILGHLGEFLPFAIHRLEQRISRLPQIQLNRSPSEVLRQNFYVTTSGNYHTPSLTACIDELGAERILFAADYPFEVLSDATTWFDALDVDPQTKASIGHVNARSLLSLKCSDDEHRDERVIGRAS